MLSRITAIKKPLLSRITANKKITLLKVTTIKKITTLLKITAIKKIMPAEIESFKKKFGVTCVCTGTRLLKKVSRKTNIR